MRKQKGLTFKLAKMIKRKKKKKRVERRGGKHIYSMFKVLIDDHFPIYSMFNITLMCMVNFVL